MKIFVSSTCYDLIDVRAEVAEAMRESGITPLLSDERTSDFKVESNVRSSTLKPFELS